MAPKKCNKAVKKWTLPIKQSDLAIQPFDIRFNGRLGLHTWRSPEPAAR